MSSDIEGLANSLRALASHAKGTGREVAQAARESATLVDLAHSQGRAGLPVAALVGQLQAAAKRGGAAASAIEQVGAHGESFADHLATTRGGTAGGGKAVGGIRADIVAAALGTVVNWASGSLPEMPSTDANCDVGTHQLADATHKIGNASADHDRYEAADQLAKRSSADITKRKRK